MLMVDLGDLMILNETKTMLLIKMAKPGKDSVRVVAFMDLDHVFSPTK